jgi:hypothetical protein
MSKKSKGSVSGVLGEKVTLRNVNGKVVLSNPRLRRSNPGASERFREAAQYARHQVSLPDSSALYQTGVTDKLPSAFRVAMTDYLSAPKVKSIDTSGYRGRVGDTIVVKAVDDFMVTKVSILIADANGATIEEGEAGPDATMVNLWNYKATAANPMLAGTVIRVIAADRPGNQTTAEKTLQTI